MQYKYLFGPVPSRRLGISLGIDVVPYKTCNLNCIYCECGKTTNLTNERKDFFSYKEIIKELDKFLNDRPSLDYITFSGAGEPLLYSKIDKIIEFLKNKFPQYKIAILTNGTLFHNTEIIDEVKKVDLIIPSLDAVSEKIFKKINRPHKELKIDKIIQGLINLRKNFKGKIFLEIFFVKGINDNNEELYKIKEIIKKIKPDKIQLNTIDRPPAEKNIHPVEIEKLIEIKNFFGDKAEIINYSHKNKIEIKNINISTILNCLERRPLTLEDLIKITNLHVNEINKILRELELKNKIIKIKEQRGYFYKLK